MNNTSLEQEIKFITNAIPELESYLLSKELYWTLGGSDPRLTPGALLLSLRKVEAWDSLHAERLGRQISSIHQQWKSAWTLKAEREITNRLGLWQAFLDECSNDLRFNAKTYTTEVRHRVIIQLLASEPHVLDKPDAQLRKMFRPGEFLWPSNLLTAFPLPEFWFLYGSIALP